MTIAYNNSNTVAVADSDVFGIYLYLQTELFVLGVMKADTER